MITRCSLAISAVAVYFLMLAVVVADEDPELFIYSIRPTKETELVWAIKCSRFMAIPVWRAGAEIPEKRPAAEHGNLIKCTK